MRKPAEFDSWPEHLWAPFGPYRAVVRHIVDGDTLDLLIDLGFNDYVYRTVRLMGLKDGVMAGMDAPEINRVATREAGMLAKAWLTACCGPGSSVLAQTLPDPDSFGRYLAVLYLSTDPSHMLDVGGQMVRAGHAVWRDYP